MDRRGNNRRPDLGGQTFVHLDSGVDWEPLMLASLIFLSFQSIRPMGRF